MADDIVVGSVAVDIVPDTRTFRKDLQAKVQGIQVDVGIKADTTGIRAELDDVTRHRDMTITANADVAEANAQLDITARDRTSTIRANVDSSQVRAVGDINRGLGGISATAATLITLGPALIPILGALAGVGLALGAPLAIAGGGATLFGFLAGFAVKDTNAQLKAIDKAQQHLSTLKKGTAEYAAAQADLKAKQDALSPAQKKFADSLDHIKGTFADLLGGKVGNQLLAPITGFLNVTADVLPKLAPIIGAVSGALSTLLEDLGNAVKGPDFQAFIKAFTQQVGPDIVSFGHIAGGVFKGVAGLVVSLGNAFGPGLLKGIQSLTDKFANFGDQAKNSQKLQDFVDYFHRVGPQVADTIGAVARAVGHIVTALAPLGPPALKVVEGIANAISTIPVPVLTGMAAAFGAMVLASKTSKGLSALGLLGSGGNGLGRSGGILGLVSKAKPVPVFVVNEGFGAGGAGGVAGKAGALGEDAAAASAASRFGLLGRLGRFLGPALSGPALITAGDAGNEQKQLHPLTAAEMKQIFVEQFGRSKTLPSADTLTAFGLSPEQARSLLNIKDLTSTTTKVDGLRASLDKASAGFDIVGHSAHRNFGDVQVDASALKAKLDAIHDKKIRVILNDLAAVQSLKALQAFRLHDKTLTINEIERQVGPGGGIGHPLPSASSPSVQPRERSGSGHGAVSGPLVQINGPVHVADTNDLLRKTDNALRARAGGGVIMRPGPTPVL